MQTLIFNDSLFKSLTYEYLDDSKDDSIVANVELIFVPKHE